MEYKNELQHYGVPGMRWGVRRAERVAGQNARLQKKALKYDAKSAKFRKKSEKQHAENDLEIGNRKAVKAAKQDRKAAVLSKKALATDNVHKQLSLTKKSENLKYKAAKNRRDADRISKTVGYGAEAMRYSIKSDKAAAKAAKARKQIAYNNYYISKMNEKVSKSDADRGRVYLDEILKD